MYLYIWKYDLKCTSAYRSLEVKANAVGWDHNDVALAWVNMSTLELYRNNIELQGEYLQKALEIYQVNLW